MVRLLRSLIKHGRTRSRLTVLLLLAIVAYGSLALVAYFMNSPRHRAVRRQKQTMVEHEVRLMQPAQPPDEESEKFTYQLFHRGMNLTIETILPYSSEELESKVTLPGEGAAILDTLMETLKERKPSILLMWNVAFDQSNLRGCPDWGCRVTRDQSLLSQASAVFFHGPTSKSVQRQHAYQYFVHYSQESPVNSQSLAGSHYNMSFSYRWDTPAASPYGYTVKLAANSMEERQNWMVEWFIEIVEGKSKTMAWFVSHCGTVVKRERLIERLKEHGVQIDVYGGCGMSGCVRDSPECSAKLNKEYMFYYTAENSICDQYITEKLFNQGYRHFVVPIVLRRAIVEPYVPPHSFIAADDFGSARELALYLRRLAENRAEYLEYFRWRLSYEVITLDGDSHPSTERPFGFCQICRLTQLEPHSPLFEIEDPVKWWDKSCEPDQGVLVEGLLQRDKDEEIR